MATPRVLLSTFETALNAALRLDPYTVRRLNALHNKVVALELRGVNVTLLLKIETDRLVVLDDDGCVPDARISGTPLAFAKLGAMQKSRHRLFGDDVHISGDAAVGAELRSIIEGADVDWEEHLSRFTGDIVAHQLGNAARGAARWAKQTADSLAQDTGDYLKYEAEHLPDRAQVDAFKRDVDALRERVEKIEARVKAVGESE